MKLHDRIKKARERLGLSAMEAATKAKIHLNTWYLYENGTLKPKQLQLMGLCSILETDLFENDE